MVFFKVLRCFMWVNQNSVYSHDVDYGNEVFNRTISFCFSSGRLDQAIDPFQNAIVDACLVKLNDAIPMSFDRIGGLFYRLQAGMGSPEIPFLKK